ncbi:RHS repeat-associated core domain-containing protein [Pseudomonas sp. R5(2019)]|uniref:RHS repeat-associated core domain-containing protein n=1 Tax=Pseudomonas sp. R5(2019) TaxID=2697566 RepID=UPI003531AEA4
MLGLSQIQRSASVYTPFGHRTALKGESASLGFNGEPVESATGYYLLGNGYRVFNPVLMRFHSPDGWSPFGSGGFNSYAYCSGDPVNHVDPTGHRRALPLPRNLRPLSGLDHLEPITTPQPTRLTPRAGEEPGLVTIPRAQREAQRALLQPQPRQATDLFAGIPAAGDGRPANVQHQVAPGPSLLDLLLSGPRLNTGANAGTAVENTPRTGPLTTITAPQGPARTTLGRHRVRPYESNRRIRD